MPSETIAQAIGAIAVIISLSIFQVNNRRTMLLLGTIAALLYSVHFLLLGALTGAVMNLIGAVRGYVFSRVAPSRRTVWVLLLFCLIAAGATWVTWQGWYSLLAASASILAGVALWQRKTENVRRLYMVSNPLWFVYNLITRSYPGMFVEVVLIVSNLIGQYRFDIRPRKTRRARRISAKGYGEALTRKY